MESYISQFEIAVIENRPIHSSYTENVAHPGTKYICTLLMTVNGHFAHSPKTPLTISPHRASYRHSDKLFSLDELF